MTLEFIFKCFFKLLAENVDSTPRKLVVKVRYDEVQGHLNFDMHFRFELMQLCRTVKDSRLISVTAPGIAVLLIGMPITASHFN